MYSFIIYSKHGEFKVLIDKDDQERVMQYNWSISKSSENYFRIESRFNKKLNRLHRFIMNISDKTISIDHKNGNTLDNRKENLRICTHKQNMRNIGKKENNKHGYIGVYSEGKKFKAGMSFNNKTIHVKGSFDTPKEAALARDELAYKYGGEFAVLNFPLTKKVR